MSAESRQKESLSAGSFRLWVDSSSNISFWLATSLCGSPPATPREHSDILGSSDPRMTSERIMRISWECCFAHRCYDFVLGSCIAREDRQALCRKVFKVTRSSSASVSPVRDPPQKFRSALPGSDSFLPSTSLLLSQWLHSVHVLRMTSGCTVDSRDASLGWEKAIQCETLVENDLQPPIFLLSIGDSAARVPGAFRSI